MTMLVQPLAIAISAIMAKIAIIAIMAMAYGCTNIVRGLVRDFNSSVLCDCRQVQYGVAHLICDRKIASVRLEDKPLKETV